MQDCNGIATRVELVDGGMEVARWQARARSGAGTEEKEGELSWKELAYVSLRHSRKSNKLHGKVKICAG